MFRYWQLLPFFCFVAFVTVSADESTIIVVGEESAPFEFCDQKRRPRGIIVDIWRLCGKKLGVRIDYRIMKWAQALRSVQEGKADVVAGMFRTKAREKKWEFSRPYYQYRSVIFFHKHLGGISEIKDLVGFRIGIMKGDAAVDIVRTHLPKAALVTYTSWPELIKSAAKNKIHVFVADRPQALHYMRKYGGWKEFRQSANPLKIGKLHGGVRKHNVKLVNFINRGMEQITDKEMQQIVNRWIGTPILRSRGKEQLFCSL